MEKHKRDNDKSSLELGWPKKNLNILAKEMHILFCKCCNGCCVFHMFCIFSLGVAVAVLDRKLYAAGGFDGRHRLRR